MKQLHQIKKHGSHCFKWLPVVVALLLIIGCAPKPTEETTVVNVDVQQLETYIETCRQEWQVPGLSVAVVKDGQDFLVKGFGIREIGKPEKVDDQTLFAIASNTKAFTAACLAILVDQGKINWDDKVQKYLPEFQMDDPWVSKEMTIRDLLCHRSGLRTFSGDLIWYCSTYSPKEIISRIKFLKPTFGFRSGYGYSNLMFITAGLVVEAVSQKPWEVFIKENIFSPLAMESTHCGIAELRKHNNVAEPHYINPEGKVVKVAFTPSDNLAGAGAINSNAADMANWLKMLLENGTFNDQRILSGNSIYEMWSPQNIASTKPKMLFQLHDSHFSCYGLGWSLADYRGYLVISHGGGLDGMISRVALVPELRLGIVVLSNSLNNLPSVLMYKIIDTFLGIPTEKAKDWNKDFFERSRKSADDLMKMGTDLDKEFGDVHAPPMSQEDLSAYSGRYHCPMYGDAEITLGSGILMLNLLPAPIFVSDLIPRGRDQFLLKLKNEFDFIPHGTGKVVFLRDGQGKITEMQIDIPNRDFHFTELALKKLNQ